MRLLLTSTACQDASKNPAYTGGDWIWLCGQKWSPDVGTVVCEHDEVSFDSLRKFTDLQWLILKGVTLTDGVNANKSPALSDRSTPPVGGYPTELLDLKGLTIEDMTVPAWFSERVPHLKMLILTTARFDLSWLAHMREVESVSFFRTDVSSAGELAALPKLATVTMVGVPNAHAIATELSRLRPTVKTRVY